MLDGRYLNDKKLGHQGKAEKLVEHFGATRITGIVAFDKVPPGMVQVVVVENAFFDAALRLDDEYDWKRVAASIEGRDKRPMTFLLMDKEVAERLTTDKW